MAGFFVGPYRKERGRWISSLTTDGKEEDLHRFAERLGLPRRDAVVGENGIRYDLTAWYRNRALEAGAQKRRNEQPMEHQPTGTTSPATEATTGAAAEAAAEIVADAAAQVPAPPVAEIVSPATLVGDFQPAAGRDPEGTPGGSALAEALGRAARGTGGPRTPRA